jgi:hypothetical protein
MVASQSANSLSLFAIRVLFVAESLKHYNILISASLDTPPAPLHVVNSYHFTVPIRIPSGCAQPSVQMPQFCRCNGHMEV